MSDDRLAVFAPALDVAAAVAPLSCLSCVNHANPFEVPAWPGIGTAWAVHCLAHSTSLIQKVCRESFANRCDKFDDGTKCEDGD